MPVTIEIWTVQMAKWKLARSKGLFLLDVTAKSGISCFAPTFFDVMKYKRGELSEEKYTEIYLAKMEASKNHFPNQWKALSSEPKVAIACYCKPNTFCHRLLFKDLMEEYLKASGYEVIQQGELLE